MNKKSLYRKAFNRMKIETKMTIAYVVLFFSIFFSLFVVAMVNAIELYKVDMQKDLNEVLDNITKYIQSGGEVDDESILNLIKYKGIKVTIFKESREKVDINMNTEEPVITEKFSYQVEDNGEIPFVFPIGRESSESSKFIEFKGVRYLYSGRKVEYNGNSYFIQVFRNSTIEDNYIRNIYIICIIANLLGLFICYFLSKLVNKKFLKGIKNISKTAENISINGLSQRIEVPKSNDEITELTVTINDMLDRLEISVIRQNQFISDVSHELRTPISVIKGYANLISRWGKDDISILEESIDSIKNEADHMINLIKKLMFLARENELEVSKKEIFLNEMIDEICKDVKIIQEDVFIELDFEDKISIIGDENLIKQMIWIFVENSIKYSGDNSPEIKISLSKDSKNNIISIKDNGIGISEEDIVFIFDRFYRGDKSRSKEISGSGLGLSIAKLIVNKHKGEITAKSKLNEGSLFTIKLPIEFD